MLHLQHTSKMSTTPVIVERVFNKPVTLVWKALTNLDQLKQWYFELADFKASVGFEFEFYGGKDENRQYLHHCKITEVVKEKKLSYTWRYVGYPGNSTVTFEFFDQGDSTRLRLIHSGIESFGSNPDFAKDEFTVGWTMFLNDALNDFLLAS